MAPPAEHQLRTNPEVADALLAGVRVVDEAWEYPEAYILDDEGRSGLDGRGTHFGEQRGVERVHAERFPGRRRTTPTVRSKCGASTISSGME